MGTNKLKEKLEKYFDLSKKKQKKKHSKLLKIIEKLEEKKTKVEKELASEGLDYKSSAKCRELSDEVQVLSRLIEKAKKKGLHTESKK